MHAFGITPTRLEGDRMALTLHAGSRSRFKRELLHWQYFAAGGVASRRPKMAACCEPVPAQTRRRLPRSLLAELPSLLPPWTGLTDAPDRLAHPYGRPATMVLQSGRNGGFIGAQNNSRRESCDSTCYIGIGIPLEWRLIANHERGVASPNRNESPSHTLISAREEYGRQEREGGGSATVLSDLAPGRGTTISIEIPVPQNSHEK
jgi:hypothetical protein